MEESEQAKNLPSWQNRSVPNNGPPRSKRHSRKHTTHHTPLQHQNGLHCLHLHRLGRRPQGVQGPGTSRDARARACVRNPAQPHARSFVKQSRTRATRTRARGSSATRALSMTRRHPARRAACARSRPSRAFLFPMASRCARTPAPVGYGIPARPRWHAKSRLRDATSGD